MFINSPHAEEDTARFGRIVLEWGHLESMLLNILLRLTHPLFAWDYGENFPQPLNRRIRLANRGYTEISAMAHLMEEAVRVLETLWPLSEKRHIIVHGYYQGFTGSGTYLFTSYRRKGIEGRFQFHHFTHADITGLTDAIATAAQQLEELSAKTFRVPFPPRTT